MFMFLPFLIATGAALWMILGDKKVSYILWVVLFIATALSFIYHIKTPLGLSF